MGKRRSSSLRQEQVSPILMNTDKIMNTIREIIADKEHRRRDPTHALYSEIYARLPTRGLIDELQRLVATGKIEEHPTIRDKSYTLLK